MSNQYRGTPAMLLQLRRETYSQQSGYVNEFEWRGMSELQARLLARDYIFRGVDYSLSINHGICTLVATDSTGNFSIDVWEIGVNKLTHSIARHPIVLGIIDRSSDGPMLRRGIKEAIESTDAYADIPNLTAVAGGDAANLYAFLDAARIGEDSFTLSSCAVRHTTNVANRYNRNISDDNVDKIYTLSRFLSEAQDPSLWVYPMPGRLQYKLSVLTSYFLGLYGSPASHLWGFFKQGSSESTAANNRVNIVTEYEFGLHNTLFYGVAS